MEKLNLRVRYLTESVVIGSKAFLVAIAAQYREKLRDKRRREGVRIPTFTGDETFCLKRINKLALAEAGV